MILRCVIKSAKIRYLNFVKIVSTQNHEIGTKHTPTKLTAYRDSSVYQRAWFACSLYPERAKYPWVGVTGPDGKGEDTRLSHGSELFMAADSKMITIGGGSVTFYILLAASTPSAPSTPGWVASRTTRRTAREGTPAPRTRGRSSWRPITRWLRLAEGMCRAWCCVARSGFG